MVLGVSLSTAEQVGEVAKQAGDIIMEIYQSDFAVEHKDDNSPVTAADKKAEKFIITALKQVVTDDYMFIGEEGASDEEMIPPQDRPFWLIDPLDGTKGFVSRNGEFTVNIALIEAGIPLLGVVHIPPTQDTYVATRAGVFVQYGGQGSASQITCRQADPDALVAVASKNHNTPETVAYLEKLNIAERISVGSSLKFCRIAEGRADVYPRFGPTSQWDTAAGHAVLMYAGGDVRKTDGSPFLYGDANLRNPFFIAKGPGVPDVED
jgi:3'(2'), 5'-bisphosphate nucleotidase